MPTSHSYTQLTELAQKLAEGQILKISQGQATLAHWGRLKAMGFTRVAVCLEITRNSQETFKIKPPPPLTDRELQLVTQVEVLQTKLYAHHRALAAAQNVLSRNADEEEDFFRDGGTLYQIREALNMVQSK